MTEGLAAVDSPHALFRRYMGVVLCLVSGSLILASGLFESSFAGALLLLTVSSALALFVDVHKGYDGKYFVAVSASQLVGIIFVYLFWAAPSGFDYYGVNEGFDPARFDYLSRNSGEWTYLELGLPGAVVLLINMLYGLFGENVFLNGISLYAVMSMLVLSADKDIDFATAVPISLLVFPDALLLFNLPAKEGYAILAVIAWYVLIFKSVTVGLPGKVVIFFILLYCCLPRPHLLGALGVALLAYGLARNRKGELTILVASIFLLASFFYFLQGDRLETISEYSAVTKAGENTESIDGTKGAVRDFFATDPRSLSHFLLTPVRFVAYIIAPFPTGGILQATSFTYEIGPSGYAPYMAMLNRFSFYSIIALLLSLVINWVIIKNKTLMMVAMFISGLIFASLYSPFLHQRYRIPFLPLLYIAVRMGGVNFGRKFVWVVVISEILSAVLFFVQTYHASA